MSGESYRTPGHRLYVQPCARCECGEPFPGQPRPDGAGYVERVLPWHARHVELTTTGQAVLW